MGPSDEPDVRGTPVGRSVGWPCTDGLLTHIKARPT